MSKESASRITKWFAEQEGRRRIRQQNPPSGRFGAWSDVEEESDRARFSRRRLLLAEDEASYVMLPPAISPEAAFSRLIEVRQVFSESNIRDLRVSYDQLSESMRPHERTVLNIAHLIGVTETLGEILFMTGKLFDVPPSVSAGDADPLSLVVSVKVGANASVEVSRTREREWYDKLAGIAPQADGRLFLFVDYE